MVVRPTRGVSLVDVIIGSALFLIIFLALIGLLRASLLVASAAKARAGAAAVGNTQLEYVRSLAYDAVGTVSGIPAGTIPQNATTTVNGIPYGVRTFIQYVDDPADGTDASDSNGITTDYKRIKVAVTYSIRGKSYELDFVSNYAPPAIETTTGGGTLKVQVVDATGAAVPGATVEVVNSALSPAVDVTTFSDADGIVYLGGAATSTEYQVFVTKSGYSSTQTYERDATNQNPTPGYLTVVKDTTTTGTFAIDRLATLALGTYYPIMATSTLDTFSDSTGLATLTNTVVSGGTLHLFDSGAGYAASGSARSNPVAPNYLASWTSASTTLSIPTTATLVVHVADGTGALLPDSALAGNSAGFSGSSIDLSGIATSTYPSLSLVVDLTTTDASTTPAIDAWSIQSRVGPIPVAGVSYTLSGAKTIGSTGAGAPIYKTTVSGATDASGHATKSLEWDSYALAISGYDVVDACPAPPYALSPGTTNTSTLYVGNQTNNALLVTVRDSAGALVSGATVTLTLGGSSTDVTTSSCGTAYFGSLSASTYTVTISKTGYTSTSDTNVPVSGRTYYAASFP